MRNCRCASAHAAGLKNGLGIYNSRNGTVVLGIPFTNIVIVLLKNQYKSRIWLDRMQSAYVVVLVLFIVFAQNKVFRS